MPPFHLLPLYRPPSHGYLFKPLEWTHLCRLAFNGIAPLNTPQFPDCGLPIVLRYLVKVNFQSAKLHHPKGTYFFQKIRSEEIGTCRKFYSIPRRDDFQKPLFLGVLFCKPATFSPSFKRHHRTSRSHERQSDFTKGGFHDSV